MVADSQGTPTLGSAAAENLLRAIAHSSELSWLTTCRDHNAKTGNTIIVQAVQRRLAELAQPKQKGGGEKPTRMTAIDQALAIWPILIKRAASSASAADAKITYGDLVVAIGYANKTAARSIRNALDLIGRYCLKHGMPTLNSIVVNRSTGEAGESVVLHNGLTPEEERINAVKVDWHSVPAPTAAALRVVADEYARRSSLKA